MVERKCATKKTQLWHNLNWLLYHGIAQAHMSLKITESVTNNNMVIIRHPPYWLDLAPVILLCFPN
jgi:hypothetical protein